MQHTYSNTRIGSARLHAVAQSTPQQDAAFRYTGNMSATQRMIAQRSALVLDVPAWGVLAMRLTLVVDNSCRTGWTDGTRLGFNERFVQSCTDARLRFFILHETLHCAFGHPWRRGTRDPREWNVAADYAINGDLLRDSSTLRIDVPDWCLISERFTGHGAEWIYAQRAENRRQQQEQQQQSQQQQQQDASNSDSDSDSDSDSSDDSDDSDDSDSSDDSDDSDSDDSASDGGDDSDSDDSDSGAAGDSSDDDSDDDDTDSGAGSGSGDAGDDSDDSDSDGDTDGDYNVGAGGDDVRDAPTGDDAQPDDFTAEDWREAVEVAARVASMGGDAGGAMARLADKSRALTYRVDWQSVLLAFAQEQCATDYTWARPSQRYLAQGLYLPSLHSTGMGAVLAQVDTSGSVSAADLAAFESLLQLLLDTVAPTALHVFFHDTARRAQQVFYPGDSVQLLHVGGGGTDFRNAFDGIEELDPQPVCCVFLTDCEAVFPDSPPDVPVLWCRVQSPWSGYRTAPPWGELVDLTL